MPAMSCLLDTCALIWLSSDQRALSRAARNTILAANAVLHFSAISALELERLNMAGRVTMPMPAERWLALLAERYRLTEIPLDTAIAALSARLPAIHRDPCDRILVATAIIHHLNIITADTTIPSYPGIRVVW